MKNVVQCVNYIHAQGLNHWQFKAFLEELDLDYFDVVYFSAVRWLSRAAILKRFWNLRKEIGLFMVNKQQDVAYSNDADWLNDIAFLTEITQQLSDLNVKLQGNVKREFKLFSQPFDMVPENSPD
ncbi:Hypothetical predicted protein [Octopus vulgaris]|uniref:Uncharacterized protein n=1 Tax=Octopus vulgaris TaxID=6645 RepID=A0AA36AFX1_OCTVU|nr:Hypothetical predicted protein [Octopus vulgaris]